MAILHQNSPDKLCSEIFADAQREHDAIVGRAKTEANAILAAARADAEKIRQELREQVQAEAAHRRERILATVAVEAGRMRSARLESILDSIRAEVRRRLLAADSEDREMIVALAAEAISRMPENNLVLEISAADHAALGNGLAHEIMQRASRPRLNLAISADGAMAGGGVVVREAAGTQIWDNRLLSRLDRFWPELRRQIAVQCSLVGENQTNGGES